MMNSMKIKIFGLMFILILSAFTMKKDSKITIFIIGDSTMAERKIDNGNLERGWGQMLSSYFTDDIHIENHAACGASTLSFINEGRWKNVLKRLKPNDYVIIQFGHNDEKRDSNLYTIPGKTFDNNLIRFIREAREKGAIPILLNSIVRRNYPPALDVPHQYIYEKEGDILVDSHGEYANSPREIAKKESAYFVDMTDLTYKLVSGLGPEKSKELFMWIPKGKYKQYPDGKIDNTHLNLYGARIIAGIAASEIVKLIPALESYYCPYATDIRVANYKDGKQCAISYTFDDGLKEHYTLVYPMLEKLGFKGTFWICGKSIEYKEAQYGILRMNWNQLKEMSDNGHEISNHGWSHLNLKGKPENVICKEIYKNDSIIEQKIGKRPCTYCYAFNSVDRRVIDLASKDRIATRLFQYPVGGEVTQSTEEELKRWVDNLLLSEQWGVTMVHGITSGYDCFSDPIVFWRHLQDVKSREKFIWIAPFREVAAYIKERENLKLKIKKNTNSYEILPLLSLDKKLFSESLTMEVESKNSMLSVKQDGKILSVKQNVNGKLCFDFNPYGGKIFIKWLNK